MPVGEGGGGGGSEHRADVDGHVEEAESGIALGGVLGVVVEITHEHLQVALEQTCSYGDQQQGPDHQGEGESAGGEGVGRDGEAEISEEHHAYARDDALSEADLVGEPAADYGHEIDCCQENGIELAGRCG